MKIRTLVCLVSLAILLGVVVPAVCPQLSTASSGQILRADGTGPVPPPIPLPPVPKLS
jgi:hypothetical protein